MSVLFILQVAKGTRLDVIVHIFPLIICNVFLGAIVPGRVSMLFALPKRATAFPHHAKGLKEGGSGVVSSSVGAGSDP